MTHISAITVGDNLLGQVGRMISHALSELRDRLNVDTTLRGFGILGHQAAQMPEDLVVHLVDLPPSSIGGRALASKEPETVEHPSNALRP